MILAYFIQHGIGYYNDLTRVLNDFLNFYSNNFIPEETGINLAEEM